VEIRAATAEELPLAAEWICGGRDAAQSLLIAFASGRERFDPREMFVAIEDCGMRGALFAQTLPAGLADFVLAPGSTPEEEDALLSIGIANAERRGVRLIQIYLDPQYPDPNRIDAYCRAGFQHATRIQQRLKRGLMNGLEPVYPSADSTYTGIPGFKLEAEFDQTLFRETLALTLEDSLDAPEAHFGASSEDILSSYPAHCARRLATNNGLPIGVAVIDVDGVTGDIEYLGVIPQFRGNGYGPAILDGILRYCAGGWASVVRVKVDERNAPAVKLYNRFGFHTYQTLDLWLLRLPQSK